MVKYSLERNCFCSINVLFLKFKVLGVIIITGDFCALKMPKMFVDWSEKADYATYHSSATYGWFYCSSNHSAYSAESDTFKSKISWGKYFLL